MKSKKKEELRRLKELRELAANRLQQFRFSYKLAEDILRDSSIRYYNDKDVEIIDAKRLRLSRE